MVNWFSEKLWVRSLIARHFRIQARKVLFTDHHDAHAASALFCSPWKDAAIMTIDGVGEWTTTALGSGSADWGDGNGSCISLEKEQRFPHSLGLLYSAFTAFLGFRVNNGEYKVMGMAPYGDPTYVDRIYGHILRRSEADAGFSLDMDYFSYHHSPERSFSDRFVDLFGEPREAESGFVTPRTCGGECDPSDPLVVRSQRYADIAASIQRVTEDLVLDMARYLHRMTGNSRLCMAGGVALNSVANGRIMRETPFEEVFIQPAAGDAGGALGAALYVYHVLLGKPRRFVMEHAYWGESYTSDEVARVLDGSGLPWERFDDETRLVERTIDAILHGRVVGLFQGRFEWGPRALGNRSIIADPRDPGMKDIINGKIKFREPFRPFAPVVPEQDASRYFEGIEGLETSYPVRYMLSVFPWKQSHASTAPAVNHMGTGRLQTVRREWNPRYADILNGFGEATGHPVLVNTSFNLRGEPIVSSPADALRTFTSSGIDNMVIGDCWVGKSNGG